MFIFSSVQFSSVAQSCPTLCEPMNQSTPDLPVHHQLLEFTQIHVHRVLDANQPSHSWSSPSPPAPIPSSIRVFSNESTLHMRWPKYWSFRELFYFKKQYLTLSKLFLFFFPFLNAIGKGDVNPIYWKLFYY